jgi:hypothetical protein
MAQVPPLTGATRRRSKPRVFKDGYGKVNSENIRGRSPGAGPVSDQRTLAFGTRTLGKGKGRVG